MKKIQLSDRFLYYNDASVCEVNIKDAMKEKISNKDSDKISPYILFYRLQE